jgi:WXG100 family type VII secretion target
MSMSSGEFTAVTFGAMSQAEADFASVYQALQNTLNTLESELNSSLSEWTGAAQQAYFAAKQQWDAAAADMATVVNSLGRVIGVANENYMSTESANTKMWGS